MSDLMRVAGITLSAFAEFSSFHTSSLLGFLAGHAISSEARTLILLAQFRLEAEDETGKCTSYFWDSTWLPLDICFTVLVCLCWFLSVAC